MNSRAAAAAEFEPSISTVYDVHMNEDVVLRKGSQITKTIYLGVKIYLFLVMGKAQITFLKIHNTKRIT